MQKNIKNEIENKFDKDVEIKQNIIEPKEIKPLYQKTKCKVVNFNKYSKVVGFEFDGVGCQVTITDESLIKDGFIEIQYKGKIGKDFEFKI